MGNLLFKLSITLKKVSDNSNLDFREPSKASKKWLFAKYVHLNYYRWSSVDYKQKEIHIKRYPEMSTLLYKKKKGINLFRFSYWGKILVRYWIMCTMIFAVQHIHKWPGNEHITKKCFCSAVLVMHITITTFFKFKFFLNYNYDCHLTEDLQE